MQELDVDWSEDWPVFHADDFGNDDAKKPRPPTALAAVLMLGKVLATDTSTPIDTDAGANILV